MKFPSQSKSQSRTKGIKDILWRRPQHHASLTGCSLAPQKQAEKKKKQTVNATNICFVHLIFGKNCTLTPPPSTPHQDPKCKPAGPSWGGRAGATACACTRTGDRGEGGRSNTVHTQFLKKSGLCPGNGIPLLVCFVLVFAVTPKQHFHSLVFPVLLQMFLHTVCAPQHRDLTLLHEGENMKITPSER